MAFQAGLLDSKNAGSMRCAYQDGQPFPHMVIQDAIQDNFLRQVRSEICRNLRFKFDENKVYRIQRSTHLANISNPDEYAPELLPKLTQLRDTLNGPEFRAWVSSITGVGPLSGTRSSMAVNMYLPGDHLLTHDDCNPNSRNRRLSFILYLTDPDRPWLPDWGGGLRLYATKTASTAGGSAIKVAEPSWAKYIAPRFNQLVFFGVRPGETYHEVEEVVGRGDAAGDAERRRLALSGWFHAAQQGDEGFDQDLYRADAQKRERLYELKAAAGVFSEPPMAFTPFRGGQANGRDMDNSNMTLSPHEVEFLSRHLAPELLDQVWLGRTRRHFAETSCLQFQPFLSESFEGEMRDYTVGHDDGLNQLPWKPAAPPERQRFLYLESSMASPTRNDPISRLLDNVLPSRAFGKWLAMVTGLEESYLKGQHLMARRFRRGLDYILADPHSRNSQPRLDYTISITPTPWCRNRSAAGDTTLGGGGGGEEEYVTAKDGAVDLAFAGRSSLQVGMLRGSHKNHPSWNQFSVVLLLRPDGVEGLVSYMSRTASGDRLDIKGKVQLDESAKLAEVAEETDGAGFVI